MINITINNQIFNANGYECTPEIVELGDRVQTLNGADHVEGRALKRHIKATFNDIKQSEHNRLVTACLSSAYLTVEYFDSISNQTETRTFILQSNPAAKMKIWKTHLKYYDTVTIDLLEKGASRIG